MSKPKHWQRSIKLGHEPALHGDLPQVGEVVRFVPSVSKDSAGFVGTISQQVTGTIVQVNLAKRWYRVEWPAGCGRTGTECFKF